MMEENRCLYCYQPLQEVGKDFHEKCSRKFFGIPIPPALDYNGEQMQELAKEIVLRSVSLTGVQPKLSLTIEKQPGDPKHSRLTIVGLWGDFILKPPSPEFQHLPENEDVTMHLSKLLGMQTAEHSLIRLQSGELAYITKRFDRMKGEKLAVEDMCQLTETLTNDKYRGYMEKVGKHILKFSSRPGFDLISFFEVALFSFLTGNADMHLKNFSLITTPENEIHFSPAYDMLCTKIPMPDDKEEMALTINAKKRKLNKTDFDVLATNLKIPEKTIHNVYAKFSRKLKELSAFIDISFLPADMKEEYKRIMEENAGRIGLI